MDIGKLIGVINERLFSIPIDLEKRPELEKDGQPRHLAKGRAPGSPRKPRTRSEFQTIVNAMTNHQRNQWARAGYPGLTHQNPAPLRRFT